MHSKLAYLIVALFLGCCLAQTPPTWGGNPVYTVNVNMTYDKPVTNWTFTYEYNWNIKAERYSHAAPEEDEVCLLPPTSFTKNKLPCEVVAATDGYIYILFPTKNFCCKCTKSFGAVRYDWLKEGATYKGIETISGQQVTHWTKPGNYLNHFYATVDKGLPVRYFETKNGIPKAWDFDLKSYSTAPIDPNRFAPQCSNKCGGTCDKLVAEDGLNLQTQ